LTKEFKTTKQRTHLPHSPPFASEYAFYSTPSSLLDEELSKNGYSSDSDVEGVRLSPPTVFLPPVNNGQSATFTSTIAHKFRPKMHKAAMTEMEELNEREKRCNTNVKEMERLLEIMKKEKEEIIRKRTKLEATIAELSVSDATELDASSSTPHSPQLPSDLLFSSPPQGMALHGIEQRVF